MDALKKHTNKKKKKEKKKAKYSQAISKAIKIFPSVIGSLHEEHMEAIVSFWDYDNVYFDQLRYLLCKQQEKVA